MDTRIVADRLSELAIFRDLTVADRDDVASVLEVRAVANGETLVEEGRPGPGLMIVRSGRAEVVKQDHGGRLHQLAVLDEGSVFGESGLLGGAAVATVRALEEMDLLVLSSEGFQRLGRERPSAALATALSLARIQSGRLHRMNQKLVEVLGREEPSAPLRELATFREKLFTEWDF